MQSEFYLRLFQKLLSSLTNDYSDNHDIGRYGEEEMPASKNTLTKKIYDSELITKRFLNRSVHNASVYHLDKQLEEMAPYLDKLGNMYLLLNDKSSKELLVDLIAYRLLGKRKVKLPLNTPVYWEKLRACEKLEDKNNTIDSGFLGWKLNFIDLSPIGLNIKYYHGASNVLIDFVLEQYRYQSPDKVIEAKPGDVVIDAGGCWGDTALYFGSKVGAKGKVFTFEFVPGNLNIFKKNLSLNPACQSVVTIVEHPVWQTDGLDTYFIDNGPASQVSFDKIDNYTGIAQTKSIDRLVEEQRLDKVDFIKMDIEGAEPYALRGAEKTIREHRPDLAIAIYHSMSDFVNIPEYIHSLGLGYKFYLGHYTIHHEETVIFATTK